jgi:hypothetical protein
MELPITYRYGLEMLFPSKAVNLIREQDGLTCLSSIPMALLLRKKE